MQKVVRENYDKTKIYVQTGLLIYVCNSSIQTVGTRFIVTFQIQYIRPE